MFKKPLVVAALAWAYVILVFIFGFVSFHAGAALFFAGIAALLAFVVMSLPRQENEEEN